MTGQEAKIVMVDALEEHLDARSAGWGRSVTGEGREAGRLAMERFLEAKGINFERVASAVKSADDLRIFMRELIRRSLS